MLAIKAEIRRYVDDWFPGWVEYAFTDAAGKEHLVVDKVPLVTTEALNARSAYPRPCEIACTLVSERRGPDGQRVLIVDTRAPWAVESTEGETQFEMLPEQVIEIQSHVSDQSAEIDHKARKHEAVAKIRVVQEVLRRWDPIGVEPGVIAPSDEYDSYAPHVVSMVEQGCALEELTAHLEHLASSVMGVVSNEEASRETAAQIMKNLKVEIR